jgi:hypothetical protein
LKRGLEREDEHHASDRGDGGDHCPDHHGVHWKPAVFVSDVSFELDRFRFDIDHFLSVAEPLRRGQGLDRLPDRRRY